MLTGRLMEAWLIDRAEERDAGRAMPSWVEPGRVGVAAVLPDRCHPSEEKARAAAGERIAAREVQGACSVAALGKEKRGEAGETWGETNPSARAARGRRWE